ncbi:MAG: esterase family protein [Dysgonamonadaceae bacterium]|jgi:S-formylglutathione hydrolase FrmB|nr:esterase family protein [Dysgonamonadaceae bacterium]
MKNLQTMLVCILTIGFHGHSFAAKTDTVFTYSDAMQKTIPAIVVTPDNYSPDKKYPVIYLLHGYSGDYTSWMNINGEYIRQTADTEEIIIVSPDGGYSSWYYDVPGDKNCQYETYIASELIRWIDRHYSTIQLPQSRGITGLSMGGHGALYLAFRHPDIFGIAGSMSGGVDIRPFPLNWDLSKRLGSYAENPENWERNTVIHLTHLLTPKTLKIIIDCGTEDFFYTVNKNLHQKLLENNIPHDFISRPGKHDAAYWKNAIQYQFVFMTTNFSLALGTR